MKRRILQTILMTFLACPLLFVWQIAHAQYTVLLNFNGNNGQYPLGSLISDGDYLYGMTQDGGKNGYGLVFKIKSDGTDYEDLLDFNGATNGAGPQGSLITDGIYLYGMTSGGGFTYAHIFKVKLDGSGYQDLLDFNGANGDNPRYGSLITDGTYLYGMTSGGGVNNDGIIFKVKTDGSGYQDLLDFNGANGQSPDGSLITDGIYLYGMTAGGGANNYGLVFKIKPNGSGYQDLLDFNGTNGAGPSGSLITDGIYLYGMTSEDNINVPDRVGNIFKIKPDGTGYQDLLDFNGDNGSTPAGSLIINDNYLYGMTTYGGANRVGLIFEIKPDGTGYRDLFDFNGANGEGSAGSLITDGNFLYGMGGGGGGAYGDGDVFKLKISSSLPLNLLSFTGTLQHNNALLNWQTTNETNTVSFTIQRSADGTNFTPLGSVAATNAPGMNNYNFTDSKPLKADNYYRLKMYDKDGAFTYSRTVLLNNGGGAFALQVYPNPAVGRTNIAFNSLTAGKYAVTVTGMDGKTLKRITGFAVTGANTLALDISGLAKGVYTVTFTSADGKHSLKLVKQ